MNSATHFFTPQVRVRIDSPAEPSPVNRRFLIRVVHLVIAVTCIQALPAAAMLFAQTLSTSLPQVNLPSSSSSSLTFHSNEERSAEGRHDDGAIVLDGAILKTIDTTTLAAQVAGPVREITVKEGEIVKPGQSLGRIVDDSLRLELEQLKTQIAVAQKKRANDIDQRLAEKSLQVATTEYQRALNANARVPDTYPINEIDRLKLVADHAQLELERAKYEQELAAFDVTLAQGNYRQTYERYTRHQLSSPAAGVIVSVEKRAGEWVEPGTDLLRIVRIDQLRVEGFIASELADPRLVGRAAHIRLLHLNGNADAGSPLWHGRVVFVSPDANPVNGQVRVFIEVENVKGTLRPGLRVDARIERNPQKTNADVGDEPANNVDPTKEASALNATAPARPLEMPVGKP